MSNEQIDSTTPEEVQTLQLMRHRGFSLRGFMDLVWQHVTQYPWEEHGRKILGPALGATAGLALANQLQGHSASFYNPQLGSELLSMPTVLVFAIVFAISF